MFLLTNTSLQYKSVLRHMRTSVMLPVQYFFIKCFLLLLPPGVYCTVTFIQSFNEWVYKICLQSGRSLCINHISTIFIKASRVERVPEHPGKTCSSADQDDFDRRAETVSCRWAASYTDCSSLALTEERKHHATNRSCQSCNDEKTKLNRSCKSCYDKKN